MLVTVLCTATFYDYRPRAGFAVAAQLHWVVD